MSRGRPAMVSGEDVGETTRDGRVGGPVQAGGKVGHVDGLNYDTAEHQLPTIPRKPSRLRANVDGNGTSNGQKNPPPTIPRKLAGNPS